MFTTMAYHIAVRPNHYKRTMYNPTAFCIHYKNDTQTQLTVTYSVEATKKALFLSYSLAVRAPKTPSTPRHYHTLRMNTRRQ